MYIILGNILQGKYDEITSSERKRNDIKFLTVKEEFVHYYF